MIIPPFKGGEGDGDEPMLAGIRGLLKDTLGPHIAGSMTGGARWPTTVHGASTSSSKETLSKYRYECIRIRYPLDALRAF